MYLPSPTGLRLTGGAKLTLTKPFLAPCSRAHCTSAPCSPPHFAGSARMISAAKLFPGRKRLAFEAKDSLLFILAPQPLAGSIPIRPLDDLLGASLKSSIPHKSAIAGLAPFTDWPNASVWINMLFWIARIGRHIAWVHVVAPHSHWRTLS